MKWWNHKWNSSLLHNWGCGGQGFYFKPNPRVISQMLSSWKHAESHKLFSNLLELIQILVYFIALWVGGPCRSMDKILEFIKGFMNDNRFEE